MRSPNHELAKTGRQHGARTFLASPVSRELIVSAPVTGISHVDFTASNPALNKDDGTASHSQSQGRACSNTDWTVSSVACWSGPPDRVDGDVRRCNVNHLLAEAHRIATRHQADVL